LGVSPKLSLLPDDALVFCGMGGPSSMFLFPFCFDNLRCSPGNTVFRRDGSRPDIRPFTREKVPSFSHLVADEFECSPPPAVSFCYQAKRCFSNRSCGAFLFFLVFSFVHVRKFFRPAALLLFWVPHYLWLVFLLSPGTVYNLH